MAVDDTVKDCEVQGFMIITHLEVSGCIMCLLPEPAILAVRVQYSHKYYLDCFTEGILCVFRGGRLRQDYLYILMALTPSAGYQFSETLFSNN